MSLVVSLLLIAAAQSAGPPAPRPSPTPSAAASPGAPSSPAAPAPVAPLDPDGTWKGTTSQGKEIELVVEEKDLKSLRVGWQIGFDKACIPPEGGPAELSREGSHFMRYQYPETVREGRLKTRIGIGRDLDVAVTGVFAADGTASGEIELLTVEASPCAGKAKATWKASRQ
jgi:hypothetical protein